MCAKVCPMNHVRNMSSLTVRRWCTRTRHVCDCTIRKRVHQIIMRVCETECGTVRAHGGVTVCARRCISLRAGRALINQQASNSATVCQSWRRVTTRITCGGRWCQSIRPSLSAITTAWQTATHPTRPDLGRTLCSLQRWWWPV
jgi:hypothetical protein